MAGNPNRRAGIIYLKIDGALCEAKGDFTYSIGSPKRGSLVGSDGVHGYTEAPQVPFIEGAITDRLDLDLKAFQATDGATVTLELANGKTIVLRDAWYANEGQVKTSEAEIPVRFEAKTGEEMK